MSVYEARTHGVVIRVTPIYLAHQSDPEARVWVWAYQVEIENRRDQPVQLLTRHWTITDAFGRSEEVRGPGVIGEQPVIEPGATYRYASGCPLPTSSGSMVGSYGMVDADGAVLRVAIPAFSLDIQRPRAVN